MVSAKSGKGKAKGGVRIQKNATQDSRYKPAAHKQAARHAPINLAARQEMMEKGMQAREAPQQKTEPAVQSSVKTTAKTFTDDNAKDISSAIKQEWQQIQSKPPIAPTNADTTHSNDQEEKLLFRKDARPPPHYKDYRKTQRTQKTQEPLPEAARTLLRRLRKEQAAVDKAAESAPDGWKYVMHWVGKTVNSIQKDVEFPWTNARVVREVARLLDYDGVNLPPKQSLLEGALPVPWAMGQEEMQGLQPMEVLDEEIRRFAAWAQPTQAEQAARQAVVDQTLQLVEEKMGKPGIDLETELFGSEATGLALANSDLDIRVYDNSAESKTIDLGHHMRELHRYMVKSNNYITAVFRWSKFPIINAQHRETGIDIQIVSSPSTAVQQDLTKQYLAELPHLRDLFFVCRTTLGQRNLIDVFNGGIGSYGLFIMLVAALKRRQSNPPTTASGQLMAFLDLYGRDLDFTTRGLTVSASEGGVSKFFKKHPQFRLSHAQQQFIQAAHRKDDPVRAGQWAICQQRPLQPYLLSLQDPADPTNDLGRKSNGAKFLRDVCAGVGEGLRADLELSPSVEMEEGGSLLGSVVGRVHEVVGAQRERVEEYGRAVLEGRQGENEALRRDEAGVGAYMMLDGEGEGALDENHGDEHEDV